jgi:hypothetical protein
MALMKEIDDSEIDEVVSFHNASYGDERTSKQWIWEYRSNYPNLSVFTVLRADNKIVGSQGMIPIYLDIKGQTCLSGKSENSLLDPKYRGGDRFKKLYDLAMSLCQARKMSCVWGFTSATRVWKDKLGFSVYEDAIYRSVLILSPREFVSSILHRKNIIDDIGRTIGAVFFYLYSWRGFVYRQLKKSRIAISIRQKPDSTNDVDELHQRLLSKHSDFIHIKQDEKYISWRVFNNPNVKYATFFGYHENVLKAYCYVAMTSRKEAYLSDLTFEDYEAGNILLRTILDFCKGKIVVMYFIGNVKNPLSNTVFDLLKKNGFIKSSYSPFVLKNLSYDDEKYLYDMKNWYINGLWTEGYLL